VKKWCTSVQHELRDPS